MVGMYFMVGVNWMVCLVGYDGRWAWLVWLDGCLGMD
jgi:hypothetical protein